MKENQLFKSKETLKKNVVLNTVFRILMIIAPFLTAPYVSRVLMSDGVGVYSYTQSLVTYFTMFAALGTISYGSREIARRRENKEQYSKAFWEIELIAVICSGLSLIAWIALSFLYTEYKVYLLILTFCILATTMDISWFYAGLEEYKYTISVNLIFKILSVISIFLFVKSPDDVWIYVLINSISLFAGNASMWLFLPKFLVKTRIEKKSLKYHFKETFVYFIPTIATSLYTVIDKTLIGALIQGETTVVINGVETVKKTAEIESGYYEQATKIIDMVKVVTFVSINSVLYSRASYLYKIKDYGTIKKMTLQAFQIVTFLTVGAAFGLIGIASTFVPLFFGAGYEKTILLLQILASLAPVVCVSGTLGSLYYSPVGKRKQSSIYLIIGAIVNLVLSAPLVLILKSVGAAIASIAAELVIVVLYVYYCNNAITLKELFRTFWKKVISGGAMLGVLILFNFFVKTHFSNALLFLFVSVIAGFAIYVLMLMILKDDSIRLIPKILRRTKDNDYEAKV
ncbi:MAG: flippase [Bacilli bacterium]